MNEVDNKRIKDFLLEKRADWIAWKKNPPMASHMGGVWEKQIRSCRTVLSFLTRTHSMSLDEESLSTLSTEVEAIVNSRPTVVETITDVNSEVAISPSHILTMKSKVVMPPPVCLVSQICIAEGDGEASSTSVINFGVGGEKKLLWTSQERNGGNHKETSVLVIL